MGGVMKIMRIGGYLLAVVAMSFMVVLADGNEASAAPSVPSSDLNYFCGAWDPPSRTPYGFMEEAYFADSSRNSLGDATLTLPQGSSTINVNYRIETWFCNDRPYFLQYRNFRVIDSTTGSNIFTPNSSSARLVCPNPGSQPTGCSTPGSFSRPSGYSHKLMAQSPWVPGSLSIPSSWQDGETRQLCLRYDEPRSGADHTWYSGARQHCYQITLDRENVWSISEDAAYIQALDSSNNPTGPRLGSNIDAAPGDHYGFYYRWQNDGPDSTDRSVRIMRTYNYPTSGESWRSIRTVGSSQAPGSTIYSSRVGHTSTIPQSAVGDSYCIQTGATPRSSTSSSRINGTRLCVNVPYNYSLEPRVDDISDVVEPGSEITARPYINNSGPTVSREADWELHRVTLPPGQSIPTGGSSGSSACTHYGPSTECDRVEHGSDRVFDLGDVALPSSGHTTEIEDMPVGTRVCFGMSVQPHSDASSNWRHSNLQCSVVGKKPKVQVWGGDVASRGSIQASTSLKDGDTYGSWGEYSVLARELIDGFKSAGELAEAGSSTSSLNLLSFANDTPSIGNFNSSTYWERPLTMSADRFRATGGSSGVPGGSMSSWSSGTYSRTGSVTLPGGTIPSNRSIVVLSTGTVTIDSNIEYNSGSMNSLSDIPQVVIVADNINIRGGVDNVDAWLLAPTGSINTCSDVPVGDRLTSEDCDRQLTINGPVVADSLHLRRTAGSGAGADSGDPAEIINLRADAYLWAYMQSTGSGRAQTVLTTEKAPRF